MNSKGDTGAYIVHPAFTNSGNGGFGELTGIWVAKFEASSSKVSESTVTTDLTTTGGGDTTNLQVRVKSNVTSWRGITVGNILTVCKNLTTSGNSMEGATNMDPHMIKSTEWGAVAYLSRSKYGKNSAVWNNSYQNNIGNMSPITGICGNSQDMSQTDFTNTYQYNEIGGENASTSGNVYGVYDMAGGAWEYVAGVLSSMKSNGSYYNFTNMDTKYYDSYDNYSDTKYGDAIYETSTKSTQTGSWDNDYSNFSTSSYPVLRQGGRSGDGINAGVFAFYSYTGQAHTCISFRPCLVRK